MSRVDARCPNCGAPVVFRWSSSVQTVCEHCRSILVRRDVDLTKVGEVSDLPPDPSPIQLATTGRYRDRPFTVVGRIVYEYDDGYWNEWHVAFDGGENGWLSDAMLDYAVSRPAPLPKGFETRRTLARSDTLLIDDRLYTVTTVTTARYRGVEGELPFESWHRREVVFADLRTHDRRFATVDYGDVPPTLYVGEAMDFDDLALRGLKAFDGWPAPA
ncbi:MAG: DUF4178 domain-containing protein [Vicinamibacterales bacterium]